MVVAKLSNCSLWCNKYYHIIAYEENSYLLKRIFFLNDFIRSGDGQHSFLAFYDNRRPCWETQFLKPFSFERDGRRGIIAVTALIVDLKSSVVLVCHSKCSRIRKRPCRITSVKVPTWLILFFSPLEDCRSKSSVSENP